MSIFRYRSADRRSLRNWSGAEILKSSQAFDVRSTYGWEDDWRILFRAYGANAEVARSLPTIF